MRRILPATPPTRRTLPTPSLISRAEQVVGLITVPTAGGRVSGDGRGVVVREVAWDLFQVDPPLRFEGVSCCVGDAMDDGSWLSAPAGLLLAVERPRNGQRRDTTRSRIVQWDHQRRGSVGTTTREARRERNCEDGADE